MKEYFPLKTSQFSDYEKVGNLRNLNIISIIPILSSTSFFIYIHKGLQYGTISFQNQFNKCKNGNK